MSLVEEIKNDMNITIQEDISPNDLCFGYLKTPYTDCEITSSMKGNDHVFFVCKIDLIRISNFFKQAFESDKNPSIELAYSDKVINLFLSTFCLDESDDTKGLRKIIHEDLHILIPIYHKYDIQRKLKKCHILIDMCISISDELVRVIVNTPGFENEIEKILLLMTEGKISHDCLEYIPKKYLFSGILQIKKEKEILECATRELNVSIRDTAFLFKGANRYVHQYGILKNLDDHRKLITKLSTTQ